MSLFSLKQQTWFFESFHNSRRVDPKNLASSSLDNIFIALLIGLQYILSLEWPDFGLKCLVIVTPKGQSYKHHQLKIFETSLIELKKKRNFILKRAVLHKYCIWFCIWYILFWINTYTFILICVQIQFKEASRHRYILFRNDKLSNIRIRLQIS